MSEEIPLKPITRSDIHKLETALMIATLLRPDVLEKIRESTERLTWIDSLAVAAGALARSKAGMSAESIADDLGRSAATIRRHLTGKTEAGRLVRETYERFAREGISIELPLPLRAAQKEVEELKRELEKEKKTVEELKSKLDKARELAKELVSVLSE
mgnify:CR=1 FL=1